MEDHMHRKLLHFHGTTAERCRQRRLGCAEQGLCLNTRTLSAQSCKEDCVATSGAKAKRQLSSGAKRQLSSGAKGQLSSGASHDQTVHAVLLLLLAVLGCLDFAEAAVDVAKPCTAFTDGTKILWHTKREWAPVLDKCHDSKCVRIQGLQHNGRHRNVAQTQAKPMSCLLQFWRVHDCRIKATTTCLCASLKPAAEPLLASGKALAYGGELLIAATDDIGVYGGSLSAAGASLRNAGDCVAQAAASCRFRTAVELVMDELREAASCLFEGGDKLGQAKEEAAMDSTEKRIKGNLSEILQECIQPMKTCATELEKVGKGIMIGSPIDEIGTSFVLSGKALRSLSEMILEMADNRTNVEESKFLLCSQRLNFAGKQMILAGEELQGTKKAKPKGKAWLKG